MVWVQYTPPEWWHAFIEYLNAWILRFQFFLYSLEPFQIVTVAVGFWLVTLKAWIRQFPRTINRMYWIALGIYTLFCVVVLSGNY